MEFGFGQVKFFPALSMELKNTIKKLYAVFGRNGVDIGTFDLRKIIGR